MLLKDVLYKVTIRSVVGSTSVEINGIQIDSRKIKPGSLFVAVKGTAADGHQFIEKAIENGAVVIVCDEMPVSKKENIVYVQVENSAAAAAFMAGNFFGNPSEKIKLASAKMSALKLFFTTKFRTPLSYTSFINR